MIFGRKQAEIDAVQKEIEAIHLNVMILFSLQMVILQTFKVIKKNGFWLPKPCIVRHSGGGDTNKMGSETWKLKNYCYPFHTYKSYCIIGNKLHSWYGLI